MQRFWKNVEKTANCWEWLGKARADYGYGRVTYRGKVERAHRVSWMLHRGEIPEGLCVLHKCDNTSCVNPDHLFLGTQADNMADAKAKGRNISGTRVPQSKLHSYDVVQIRASNLTQRELGELYQVSHGAIGKIKRNETWSNI